MQNIKLNALPVYDDRYIKTKIKTYDDKVYLNVPEDGGVECEFLTIISIDSLWQKSLPANIFRQLCL